jgi:prophage regulatory protein
MCRSQGVPPLLHLALAYGFPNALLGWLGRRIDALNRDEDKVCVCVCKYRAEKRCRALSRGVLLYTIVSEGESPSFTCEVRMSISIVPRLLDRSQVLDLLGVTRQTLYAWMRSGRFPQPLKLGPASYRWRESDVLAWLDRSQQLATV